MMFPAPLIAASTASSGAHSTESIPLSSVLVLIGIIGAAYLIGHVLLLRFQKRFLAITGLEYIVLGAVLGPSIVPDVQILADLDRLVPILGFACGWVGLLYGMDVGQHYRKTIELAGVRLAVIQFGVVTAIVSAGFFGLMESGWWFPPLPFSDAWVGSITAGCAATATASSAVYLIQERYPKTASSETLLRVFYSGQISTGLAILLMGGLFCIFHNGASPQLDTGPSDWILMTVCLGILLGLLFALYLGHEDNESQKFLVLVGILLFASGATFFLQLSVIAVNFLLGIVLVNSRQGQGLLNTVKSSRQPTTLILLVFAGALWRPVPWLPGIALVGSVVVLRWVGLTLSARLASYNSPLRHDLSRGLIGQGDGALAIAITAQLMYDGIALDYAYTATLASVVVYQAFSPRRLRDLLADSGELKEDSLATPSQRASGA